MLKPTSTFHAAERTSHRRTPASLIAAGTAALALSAALMFSAPVQAFADTDPTLNSSAVPAAQLEASILAQSMDTDAADETDSESSLVVTTLLSGLDQPDALDHINDCALEADKAAKERLHAQRVDAILSEAYAHEGAPYVYGGTTPSGFDCSGFTSYVFRSALGIELPRTAAAQSGVGTSVPMDSLERGDLLFWGSGSGVYHVGIYVGEGNYIHAAGTGKGVRVQSMEWFTPSFAKRVL